MSLPCPACGFLTVPDAYFGSYNICGVCGWEDDGVQLANPACGGGANPESLIDAQVKALAEFPLGRAESRGASRDSAWRPLSDEEIRVALREREERYWRNTAVEDLSGAYWTRLPNKPWEPASAAAALAAQGQRRSAHLSTLRLASSNSDVVVELSGVDDDYFRVSVVSHDHSATLRVYAYTGGAGIARLLAEAAREWRGWQEPKVWESLEGELRIELRVDRLGHVTVAVRLQSDAGRADGWRLDAELGLDAGQLAGIAREASRLWCGGG